jgi:hypothetical protein
VKSDVERGVKSDRKGDVTTRITHAFTRFAFTSRFTVFFTLRFPVKGVKRDVKHGVESDVKRHVTMCRIPLVFTRDASRLAS